MTFEQIVHSAGGVVGFLQHLQEDLTSTSPKRYGRVHSQGERQAASLGIPTIRDRVAQMAHC